jgi:hypothetical protein
LAEKSSIQEKKMTTKHFIAVAEILRDTPIADDMWMDRARLTEAFADLFEKENPRFHRESFLAMARGDE